MIWIEKYMHDDVPIEYKGIKIAFTWLKGYGSQSTLLSNWLKAKNILPGGHIQSNESIRRDARYSRTFANLKQVFDYQTTSFRNE